ncbi:MAG: hypothetical protein SFV23_07080 [Planctomycetaceae bacterium]|nr:hypothetical protein [Planctomycetaceae bacterium]
MPNVWSREILYLLRVDKATVSKMLPVDRPDSKDQVNHGGKTLFADWRVRAESREQIDSQLEKAASDLPRVRMACECLHWRTTDSFETMKWRERRELVDLVESVL